MGSLKRENNATTPDAIYMPGVRLSQVPRKLTGPFPQHTGCGDALGATRKPLDNDGSWQVYGGALQEEVWFLSPLHRCWDWRPPRGSNRGNYSGLMQGAGAEIRGKAAGL